MTLSDTGTLVAPIADHFKCSLCGACPNLHVLLLDAEDKPIAQAIFSAMQLVQMTEMALNGRVCELLKEVEG